MSTNHQTATGATSARPDVSHADHRCPMQTAAMVIGATFLTVGILGFIPGITTHYGDMEFAGHESAAKLLGVFQVSVLHNLVHLAFGIVGLVAAKTARAARSFLVVGGVIYLGLFVYGLIVDNSDDGNFVPVNNADDWLHLILGLGMIAIGAALWNHHRVDQPSSGTRRR